MKLIKPSVEYIPQEEERIPFKHIELCARTCYKSEDKITEDSAHKFVDRLIRAGHWAMLEHGTVYLMIHTIDPKEWDKKIGRHKLVTVDDCREDLRTNPTYDKKGEENWWAKEAVHKAYVMAVKYADNPYSKVKITLTSHELNTEGHIIITPTGQMPNITRGFGKVTSVFNTVLVTTNYRVLVENDWLDDLQYAVTPFDNHWPKRYTIKFICDRGVSHELVRHRKMSFAQESQRYCNYSKDKFGGVSFIEPSWFNSKDSSSEQREAFIQICQDSEECYLKLLDNWDNKKPDRRFKTGFKGNPLTPQQARCVLPNATKTEIVMTGFEDDWKHFFDLRLRGTTGKPHPDMLILAEMAHNTLKENVGIEL